MTMEETNALTKIEGHIWSVMLRSSTDCFATRVYSNDELIQDKLKQSPTLGWRLHEYYVYYKIRGSSVGNFSRSNRRNLSEEDARSQSTGLYSR